MAAAIPVIISLLAEGGGMIAANQANQEAKGKAADLTKQQGEEQAALLSKQPPAVAAPKVNTVPTDPGKLGRRGTLLTGPTTPEETAPTQRKTLLGL